MITDQPVNNHDDMRKVTDCPTSALVEHYESIF